MDPATWIYLALLAASTASSAKSQQKTNQARAQVQSEETSRRKVQQAQAEAAAQKTQEAYFGQRDKTAAREAELAQQFAPSQAVTPTTDASGSRFLDIAAPTSSTATIEASKNEAAQGQARATQRATSRAQLGAFGDVLRENNLAATRNAQDIGLSANMMYGWQQNVLPALYAKANTAGKDWSTAADVMKLAAAVMAPAALGGGGTAAATPAGGGASSTAGVLARMGGTPSEFVGAFPQMTGVGFQQAANAGAGAASAAGSSLMANPAYEKALLDYLNDPYWYLKAKPEHWDYFTPPN